MRILGVDEAMERLRSYENHEIYLHMEVNPHGYLRNAKVLLQKAHIHGDGDYRIYLEWKEPSGLVQFGGVTEIAEDEGAVIFTAYDAQDRILETLMVSPTPFRM